MHRDTLESPRCWQLDKDHTKRFIDFLKEKKRDNIRKDIKVTLEKFNEEMQNIEKKAKKMDDDSSLNEYRKSRLKSFWTKFMNISTVLEL